MIVALVSAWIFHNMLAINSMQEWQRPALIGCIRSDSSPSFPRIAGGLKVAQAQAMAIAVGFLPDPMFTRSSPLFHRASFHGRGDTHIHLQN